MPAGPFDGVIRQLRKVALVGQCAQLDDAQLLERFISRRDERAFELLLQRHGSMVLGVCRRVLGNRTDAEDAFQATFVVFVRKAASIRPRSKVANWLYGVAHKTALKARAMNQRRRIKERAAAAAVLPNGRNDTWTSLLEVLDDELSGLPEKYRTAIVLCDLQGLSYREAAARLGCPQGTLSGRLTRARVLLARRIARHGLTFSAGALATLLAGRASAVSPSLLTFTIRTLDMVATGTVPAADAVAARVALLAEGVMKMMLLSKLKALTGVFFFVAAAVVAGWVYAGDDAPAPIPRTGTVTRRAESQAEFVFLCEDKSGKTVSLVVAGTSAPVLSLPVKDDLRVLLGGRRVTLDRLPSGTRVAIRMNPTNRAIQEIDGSAIARQTGVVPKEKPPADNSGHTPIIRASAAHLKLLRLPTTEEVLRVLPRARRVPGIYEESRDDVEVTFECLVDKIDQPRFYPLLGPAQLHQRHFKCTVSYTETVVSTYPIPFRSRRPRVEVVYIDKDYLLLGE
jgi:RNA polymerase sigma factor (sigma-70 family)